MAVKAKKKVASKKAVPAPKPKSAAKKTAGSGLERVIIAMNKSLGEKIERQGERLDKALLSMAESIAASDAKIAASDAIIAESNVSIKASLAKLARLDIDRYGERLDKALLSIAESIAASDAKFAESNAGIKASLAKLAKLDAERRGERLDKALLSMTESIAASDAKIAASDASIAASDAKIAEAKADIKASNASIAASLAKLARLDTVVDGVKTEIGGLSESYGRSVESLVCSFFDARMTFAGVPFDYMEHGVNRKGTLPGIGKVQGEYDVVLYNGTSIALIEAKNRVRMKDIDKLLDVQMPRFKLFFSQYKDFKYYLGICGMSFEDGVEAEALDRGIGILKPNGDAIEINEATVKVW